MYRNLFYKGEIMNKRQAKKTQMKRIFRAEPYGNFSYSEIRKKNRKAHVLSIECARRRHENFWDKWKRGYPNRFPYSKWFMVPATFYNAEDYISEDYMY